MCTSLLINTIDTRKSFTILADDEYDSMSDRFDSKNTTNLPVIANKIKSVYHQNCIVPNEDFSILYNSIASKLQPPSNTTISTNKVLYSPSKEFFNKVSSKLRDLRPPNSDQQLEELSKDANKMERPMFITTVKSGTFLEPPPEVAALLGLRKNSFSNTNSSNSSTAKAHNDRNVVYSFASKPRILKSNLQTNFASRSLFRVENRREKRETLNEPLPKITNDTSDGGAPSYGNTMFDRRVARGSNFAAQRPNVISTEHVLSRQAEARRRAAVRQRAQIRARKLRLGTPPPIDGRRHGQIQTDKFLEELTERPPDKSIACQADLPVQYHSPVHSLDSNMTTGVEAETQIYPGDLPDIDDELPSVVSSIVNKILHEAILEINDEIEVIRLRTLASEQKRAVANSSTSDEIGVITKAQLQLLIQQAINELIQSDSNDKNYDGVNGNRFLEKIFDEIKNTVTDVKFLTGIIKTQLENWPETSNENNEETEFERSENEQTDEENNASDNQTVDLRKESLSAVDDGENEITDEGFQQDVEIDNYKTDDFEEESKDLVDGNEPSGRRDNLDTNPNTRPRGDLETIEAADGSNSGNGPLQAAGDDLRDNNEREPTANNDNTNETDSAKVDGSRDTDSEIVLTDQEVPNGSPSQMNGLTRGPPPVIVTEHNDETAESVERQSSRDIDDSNKENEESKPADEGAVESTNDNLQNDPARESNQNSTNDDQSPETDGNVPSSTNQSTVTIPTMNASLRDPPVNDSNSENDINIKDALENQPEGDPTDDGQPSENDATLTIPAMNLSLLDPPVNEIQNENNDESVVENGPENQTNFSNHDQDVANGEKIEPSNLSSNSGINNDQSSGSIEAQTTQNEQNTVNNIDNNDSNKNATNKEPVPSSTNQKDATNNPNNDQGSSPSEGQPSSNEQNVTSNENSSSANDQALNSNEQEPIPSIVTSTEPSAEPDTSNGESSEPPTKIGHQSANEDDNDVIAVQASASELSPSNSDVTSGNTEPQTTSSDDQVTQKVPDSANTSENNPTESDNNETTMDNLSESSSSATTKAESSREKPSDSESVENNELQSNIGPSEDPSNSTMNSQNLTNDNGSSQESDKPLNTENPTPARDDQLNEPNRSNSGTNNGIIQHESQNSETVLDNSTVDSSSVSEPPASETTTANAVNSSQAPEEPLVNGDSDTEPAIQTDIDARNNNSNESNKSLEANNNDSTIQSNNPATIVQNGNIVANR